MNLFGINVNKYKTINCPVHIIQADQRYSNLLTDAQLSEIKEKYITHATHITGLDHNLQINKNEEIQEILLNYFFYIMKLIKIKWKD